MEEYTTEVRENLNLWRCREICIQENLDPKDRTKDPKDRRSAKKSGTESGGAKR